MRATRVTNATLAATLLLALVSGCHATSPRTAPANTVSTAQTPSTKPTPPPAARDPLDAEIFDPPVDETQAVADASAAAHSWHTAQHFAFEHPAEPRVANLANFATGEVLHYALTTVEEIGSGMTSVSGTSEFRVIHGGIQGELHTVHLHACVDNSNFEMRFQTDSSDVVSEWPNGGVYQTRLELEFHDGHWIVVSDWVRGTLCDE